jgi:hypothetical protein
MLFAAIISSTSISNGAASSSERSAPDYVLGGQRIGVTWT